jgi:large subunit ribosomal protein L11
MATKEVTAQVKLQISAGKANPAPPIGPALGPHGINIMDFCNQFNAQTKALGETVIPTILTIYKDRSFTFILKTPPAAELIKKAAGIIKGSGTPNKEKVGKITMSQVKEIAEKKLPDLNAFDVEKAMEIIKGTARSMGVEVTEN